MSDYPTLKEAMKVAGLSRLSNGFGDTIRAASERENNRRSDLMAISDVRRLLNDYKEAKLVCDKPDDPHIYGRNRVPLCLRSKDEPWLGGKIDRTVITESPCPGCHVTLDRLAEDGDLDVEVRLISLKDL